MLRKIIFYLSIVLFVSTSLHATLSLMPDQMHIRSATSTIVQRINRVRLETTIKNLTWMTYGALVVTMGSFMLACANDENHINMCDLLKVKYLLTAAVGCVVSASGWGGAEYYKNRLRAMEMMGD